MYRFLPPRRDAVIIDCGANIGLSVIYFKKLCPEARIVAFEPDPSLCDLLIKNVQERDLCDVEVRNSAVWIDGARLGFNADGALGGRISEGCAAREIEVQAVRLRDFLNGRIDFLKMDVEGAEYAVLKDCRDRLMNVENLFVEYHVGSSEEQRLDEMLSWFSDAGFRYYISEASQLQCHPFVSKGADVFEMQLNIWCYRTASWRPKPRDERLLFKVSGALFRAHRYLDWRLKMGAGFVPRRSDTRRRSGTKKVVHVIGNFIVGGSTQLIVDIIEGTLTSTADKI